MLEVLMIVSNRRRPKPEYRAPEIMLSFAGYVSTAIDAWSVGHPRKTPSRNTNLQGQRVRVY